MKLQCTKEQVLNKNVLDEHQAPSDLCPILTREQGADLFPAGDAAFRGVLAYDYL